MKPTNGIYRLNIPNFITLGRIVLVPVVVWAIASSQMMVAIVQFAVAGLSDAVDGFLAKRFNMTTELGALLDPIADKARLVSIDLARDRLSGGVARFHDRGRDDPVVDSGHPDAGETADGLEAEHGGAGRFRGVGAGLARVQIQCVALRCHSDGGGDDPDVAVGP